MNFSNVRRDILKAGLAAGATLVGGSLVPPFVHRVGATAARPDVVIARGQDPAANVQTAVEALGGMEMFVKKGDKVVIKPNMSFARNPEEASNTNPAVVAEIARLCAEAGAARIAILDNVLHSPADCFRMSGVPGVCEVLPNTIVKNVDARRLFRQVDVPRGVEVKSLEVAKDVLEADVLIAAPVGKSHGSAGVSLSMKGMMGLIYDRGAFHSRYNLHQAIADMVTVIKPQLVVVDGTRILSTGGPGGPGKVIPMNLVVASPDMVAADAQMLRLGTWYGKKFRPDQVRHIRLAAQQGLGRMDLDNLSIKDIKESSG